MDIGLTSGKRRWLTGQRNNGDIGLCFLVASWTSHDFEGLMYGSLSPAEYIDHCGV